MLLHNKSLSSFLESENNFLQVKVKKLQTDQEACCQQQQRIHQLEEQLSDIQLLLDKERAKYQSACRQQEVCVSKRKEKSITTC